MVRNYKPGPDWVPATVVACLGPLSYLVETEKKQLWRRHIKAGLFLQSLVQKLHRDRMTVGDW